LFLDRNFWTSVKYAQKDTCTIVRLHSGYTFLHYELAFPNPQVFFLTCKLVARLLMCKICWPHSKFCLAI